MGNFKVILLVATLLFINWKVAPADGQTCSPDTFQGKNGFDVCGIGADLDGTYVGKKITAGQCHCNQTNSPPRIVCDMPQAFYFKHLLDDHLTSKQTKDVIQSMPKGTANCFCPEHISREKACPVVAKGIPK